MSLEFRPAGVSCNIGCKYCYQQPTRDTGNVVKYDKAAVWNALSTTKEYWSLFGGEALLLPLSDLEELLELGFSRFGHTGVQTNGTLITPRHIELFDKYKTHVGISIDGPSELNDIRWAGTLEGTRKLTARTEDSLTTLAKRSVAENKPFLMPSIICTLHKGNIGSIEKQNRMVEWFHELDALKIPQVNLHVMELDYEANEWALPVDVQTKFLIRLWDESTSLTTLKFFKFQEILQLLMGDDRNAVCVWHACDPWNTQAVQGLEGDGSPSHCTRTNKDGKTWLPAVGTGKATEHAIGGFQGNRYHERQLSLYVTPQEQGGCKDCRFWLMCLGQCPGTGEASATEAQGDWRLRSSYCELWKNLFAEGERRLIATEQKPISLWKNRKDLEARMYELWASGEETYVEGLVAESKGLLKPWFNAAGHGDHVDASQGVAVVPVMASHGDEHGVRTNVAHADQSHSDAHGDHQDLNSAVHVDQSHTDSVIKTHGDGTIHTDQFVYFKEQQFLIPHTDTHFNNHGNHTDADDIPPPHGDAHGDEHADHIDSEFSK